MDGPDNAVVDYEDDYEDEDYDYLYEADWGCGDPYCDQCGPLYSESAAGESV